MEVPEQLEGESNRDYALFCDWLMHRSLTRTGRNAPRVYPHAEQGTLTYKRVYQISKANRWKERAPQEADPLSDVIADNRAEAANLCMRVLDKSAEMLADDPDMANKLLGGWSRAMSTVDRLKDSNHDRAVTDAAMSIPLRDLADAMVKNVSLSDLDSLVTGDRADGEEEGDSERD